MRRPDAIRAQPSRNHCLPSIATTGGRGHRTTIRPPCQPNARLQPPAARTVRTEHEVRLEGAPSGGCEPSLGSLPGVVGFGGVCLSFPAHLKARDSWSRVPKMVL